MEFIRASYETVRRNFFRRGDTEDAGILVGDSTDPPDKRAQLESRIQSLFMRFCYRFGMPTIGDPSDNVTSDSGWGCMHRSAQMLLARALMITRKIQPSSSDDEMDHNNLSKEYCSLLQLFMDDDEGPHQFRPYSIHAMVNTRLTTVAKWLGPSKAAHILRDIVHSEEASKEDPLSCKMNVVVADQVVYVDVVNRKCWDRQLQWQRKQGTDTEVKEEVCGNNMKKWSGSLLLLIPVRLGVQKVNDSMYKDSLLAALRDERSVGIIGGLPNRALYIVGHTDHNFLIGLDPHYPLPYVDQIQTPFPSENLIKSVCDRDIELLDVAELDASLALGFIFSDYEQFCVWTESWPCHSARNLFSVELQSPTMFENDGTSFNENDLEENISELDSEDSDFVLV